MAQEYRFSFAVRHPADARFSAVSSLAMGHSTSFFASSLRVALNEDFHYSLAIPFHENAG
ncbi:MAG: hypothetical protein OJF50_003775 [Nitrospira sp.]|nr:hypothetical protein [Nitrospira sp.]